MTKKLIGATFCSGIGTPELAAPQIDWRFASEIEKFPRAVLQHRFGAEDVRRGVSDGGHALWGDLTTVRIRHYRQLGIPLPEIVVAGLPCQAFSIAGLRKSLSDDRGNLTLRFLGLLHGFRAAGSLRNFVFENVPGILSAADNPFGCLLAGLVGADDPLVPPDAEWGPKAHFDGRSHNVHRTYGWKSISWPSEGMVEGPLGRAAWRVLDAQHFGLAQRRKRVFVVYDTGKGADPAAVLFERKSVHGYHPKSRKAREGVAPTISARTKGGGGLGTDFDLDGGLIESCVDVAPCLRAGGNSTGGDRPYGTDADTADSLIAYTPEIARCVATREGSSQDYETTMVAVGVHGDVAHTLKAEGADASEDGTGRGTPIVAFQSKASASQSMNPSEVSPTLDASKSDGIAICFTAKDYGGDAQVNLSPTLRVGGHSGSHANAGVMPAVTVAIRGREGGATAELGGEVATALRASQGGGDKPHVLVGGVPDVAGTMKACAGKSGGFSNSADHAAAGYMVPVTTSAVRRLTPVECERLQGLPDNWTLVPWRGNRSEPDFSETVQWLMSHGMSEKEATSLAGVPDGPRYRAIGNGMALDVVSWVLGRIVEMMPNDK